MVERWDVQKDGPLNEEALRKKLEARGYRVSRSVYPPGTSFPEHTHRFGKIDAVISGRFKMTVGGKTIILEGGDCIIVPRGELHNAEVFGNEPVVSLDATRE